MKIVYCTDTICYSGGIQKVTIAKANALANIAGNEVWIFVTDNQYSAISIIEDRVHVIDLQINYYQKDCNIFLYFFKVIFYKRKMHKKRLQKKLNEISPDIVISTGTSEKYFLPFLRIDSRPCCIRELHFEKYYRSKGAHSLCEKMLASMQEWYDYSCIIRKYDQIVVLTQVEKELDWNGYAHVSAIANPVITLHQSQSKVENHVVIAVGRLVSLKRFDSLIKIWKKVTDVYSDWSLKIWGNGNQELYLKELISSLDLEGNVKLMGYTSDIISELGSSSIYVLSSSSEGFPLSVLEAMSVGLPIVAYNCSKGLPLLVSDGENGYLVRSGNESLFEKKLRELMASLELRQRMGLTSLEKSKEYIIETIIQQWMNLFNELISNKSSGHAL